MKHTILSCSNDWIEDCLKWRGTILTGLYSHWCNDWDGLPIDETTPEWPCICFSSFWFRLRWRIVEWWKNL